MSDSWESIQMELFELGMHSDTRTEQALMNQGSIIKKWCSIFRTPLLAKIYLPVMSEDDYLGCKSMLSACRNAVTLSKVDVGLLQQKF